MNIKHQDYSQSQCWINQEQKQDLLEVIRLSFRNIEPEKHYQNRFEIDDCFERKLRLFINGTKVVGYCLLLFKRHRNRVIIDGSAAFLPSARHGSNTMMFCLLEAAKYKLKHPTQQIFYGGYMLSPAMYRAVAKPIATIWPSKETPPPARLFDELNPLGIFSPHNQLRCLRALDFQSSYSAQDVQSFRTSHKSEFRYYCQVNPDFDRGVALFVIIPVSLKQLILSILKRFKNKEISSSP
ncbi:hypothetical protein [Vibrio comitans]